MRLLIVLFIFSLLAVVPAANAQATNAKKKRFKKPAITLTQRVIKLQSDLDQTREDLSQANAWNKFRDEEIAKSYRRIEKFTEDIQTKNQEILEGIRDRQGLEILLGGLGLVMMMTMIALGFFNLSVVTKGLGALAWKTQKSQGVHTSPPTTVQAEEESRFEAAHRLTDGSWVGYETQADAIGLAYFTQGKWLSLNDNEIIIEDRDDIDPVQKDNFAHWHGHQLSDDELSWEKLYYLEDKTVDRKTT